MTKERDQLPVSPRVFDFEPFLGGHSHSGRQQPRVSFYRSKTITFNEMALKLLSDPIPERVFLLYDRVQRIPAVRCPTLTELPYSYRLTKQVKSRGTWQINAVGFVTHYDIPFEQSLTWAPAEVSIDPATGLTILVLDPAKAKPAGRQGSRKLTEDEDDDEDALDLPLTLIGQPA